jgi:hypothetical protein
MKVRALSSAAGRDKHFDGKRTRDWKISKGGVYEDMPFNRALSLIRTGHVERVSESDTGKIIAQSPQIVEVKAKLKYHELKKWLKDRKIPFKGNAKQEVLEKLYNDNK